MKDKIDSKKMNTLVDVSIKLLKILIIPLIIVSFYLITLVFRELKVVGFLLVILKCLMPFFIGAFISWLLSPFVNKLTNKGINKFLAVAIVFVVFIVLILSVVWVILSGLNKEVYSLIPLISEFSGWINNFIDSTFSSLADYENIKNIINSNLDILKNSIMNTLPDLVVNIVTVITSSIGNFLMSLIISFYLLISKRKFGEILPIKLKETVEPLQTKINTSLRSYIIGMFLVSFCLFLVLIPLYSIIGLRSPAFYAFICGVTDLIPYIGAWIGGAIAVLVGFSMNTQIGVLTLIVITITQLIESYVFKPMIASKTAQLNPITVIISLALFGKFWGIFGMLIAAPVMAVLKFVAVFIDERYHILDRIIK